MMNKNNGISISLLLLIACFLLAVYSLFAGAAGLSALEVWQGLWSDAVTPDALIVQAIRLPRTILALAIGASLGLSGAVMQSWLRNPLADAGLLGASSLAALGAVITLYMGIAAISSWLLPITSIMFAFGGLLLLSLFLGRLTSSTGLILAGLAIQYLAFAGISLTLNFAPNPHAALEIAFWLLGSLKDRSHEHVMLALPFIALGVGMLLTLGRSLDALSLGEQTAQSLGVNLMRLRALCAIGTSLAIGASVAVSGAIGFVGLIVPHLLRPFVGGAPSRLLIPSALGGALLLLAADIFIRLIPVGQELKLGVTTSIIGAPFFLYILYKMRKSVI